jgi:hypothetical protein
MPDIKFGENFQPKFSGTKDIVVIDGREEFEQWIALESTNRLYGILEQFDTDEAENKIRTELNRIARESNLLEDVEDIEVRRLTDQSDAADFEVAIIYEESENFETELRNI